MRHFTFHRFFILLPSALVSCALYAAEAQTPGAEAPRLSIQSKLFFVDPGSHEANVAIKVTFDNSPRAVFLAFHVQGTDKDGFILADLLMHGMKVEKGGHSTCTKRFELSVNDFRRITKWQLADAKFMDIGASWRLDSLLVRAIPDKDSPSIGSLLFRGKCSRIGFGKLSEKIAIQGIDDAGFELCHFVFEEYDCISESASGSRRGRWTMSANALEFDGFKSVFRPKDFSELPAVQHWRAMPMEDNLATWDGDAP